MLYTNPFIQLRIQRRCHPLYRRRTCDTDDADRVPLAPEPLPEPAQDLAGDAALQQEEKQAGRGPGRLGQQGLLGPRWRQDGAELSIFVVSM